MGLSLSGIPIDRNPLTFPDRNHAVKPCRRSQQSSQGPLPFRIDQAPRSARATEAKCHLRHSSQRAGSISLVQPGGIGGRSPHSPEYRERHGHRAAQNPAPAYVDATQRLQDRCLAARIHVKQAHGLFLVVDAHDASVAATRHSDAGRAERYPLSPNIEIKTLRVILARSYTKPLRIC